MSAYVIAQLDVHDMAEFEKYLAGFYAIFERHGGKLVGRSLEAEIMEGEWAMPRTVVMRSCQRRLETGPLGRLKTDPPLDEQAATRGALR